MKNSKVIKKYVCISILSLCLVIFIGNMMIMVSDSSEHMDKSKDLIVLDTEPRQAVWDLSGSDIYINDYFPGYNSWSDTATREPWCSYVGGVYIIENVLMEGDGHISIMESHTPFILRNCVLRNAGKITIQYTSNGQLLNNEVEGASYGIHLFPGCHDMIVSGNTLIDNDYGVVLEINCYDNTISGNTIQNSIKGIYLDGTSESCDHNEISGNILDDMGKAIHAEQCDDLTLTGNIITKCEYGIVLSGCDNPELESNVMGDTSTLRRVFLGISLGTCNYATLTTNTIDDYLSAIAISNSYNSILTGNTMSSCGIGFSGSKDQLVSWSVDQTNTVNGKAVYFYNSQNGLQPSDFTMSGTPGQILILNCNHSLISGITMTEGISGISLRYCNDNLISSNSIANQGSNGIDLEACNNNTIIGNTLAYTYAGIDICGDENNITDNMISDSGYGIWLHSSFLNNVSLNTINSTTECAIYLSSSNYNTINDNTMKDYVECIQEGTGCETNYIYNNLCEAPPPPPPPPPPPDDDGGDSGDGSSGGGSSSSSSSSESDGSTIPGYDLFTILSIISIISVVLIKKRGHFCKNPR